MISDIGHNLSVLIVSKTNQDWQTFATWYSIYKNLPSATVSIVNYRNGETPFVYYQWAKRLKIRMNHALPFDNEDENLNKLYALKICQEKKLLQTNVLIVEPLFMAIESLDSKVLDLLNKSDRIINDNLWFFKNVNATELINNYCLNDEQISKTFENICFEAKDTNEIASLITYKKGCGRWIDTAKGCPFSSAGGLISADMTVNENRVIEMWQKLVPLYNAVV